MKKIEVIVRDKNTLILEEDAKKGDYIDLSSISNVDFVQIETALLSGKDAVYNQKLKEYTEKLKLESEQKLLSKETDFALEKQKLTAQFTALQQEYQNNLVQEKQSIKHQYELENQELNNKIEVLNQKYTTELAKIKQEEESKQLEKIQALNIQLEQEKTTKALELSKLQNQHQLKINELENKISSMNSSLEDKVKAERLEVENQYNEKINQLNQFIVDLKNEKEKLELSHQLLLEKKISEQTLEFEKEKKLLKDQIESLNQVNNQLQRQKASLNVKQTGEDLEVWCDNEVRSYMQNGLEHCTWEKDNVVVRNDDEVKGSKADYLFSIFASKDKQELLANVCLDMKDENPDSVNRKKNSDYYKALDNNRRKKDCKYAVLVSNLELDKPNDIPIYKVMEYEDMYVVRPAYLMTFLNMLVSLTTRFKDLLIIKEKENLELKSRRELQEEFEKLKNTYLDKPLETLEKNIDEIRKQNEGIAKASRKIDEICDTIKRNYLNEITNKLERFDIKIHKTFK